MIDKPAVPVPFGRLSPRELEVVTMIAEGASHAQIAEVLGCSSKTIDTHRANALKKLSLRHNVDLTREAICVGLVKLDGGAVVGDIREVNGGDSEPCGTCMAHGYPWLRGVID